MTETQKPQTNAGASGNIDIGIIAQIFKSQKNKTEGGLDKLVLPDKSDQDRRDRFDKKFSSTDEEEFEFDDLVEGLFEDESTLIFERKNRDCAPLLPTTVLRSVLKSTPGDASSAYEVD